MKLKNLFVLIGMIMLMACNGKKEEKDLKTLVTENLDFSLQQYERMAKSIEQDSLANPRTIEDGKLKVVDPKDWTSGFYPGTCWYLYEYTKDDFWKREAAARTEMLEELKDYTGTHDLGFMIYCSYGNGYRLIADTTYKQVMLQGAKSLISRFKPTTGCIRSWDHGTWQYPVIIDNMMNLEFLFWASKESGDSIFQNISLIHANTTMKNHFRENFSSFHVLDYDTTNGNVISKGTHQGFSDESAWARGQAWGLYGYTVMYRETREAKYLEVANNIANFILSHATEDMVPYWDYNAPAIPDEPRDASAAAITCSALLELQQYVNDDMKSKYIVAAEKIIRSLSSSEYRANLGENMNFILKHSVGSKPHGSEVDVPLNYADYYFVESLLRFKNILK